VVLAYQGWSFRVFRRRVTAESASTGAQPVSVGAAAVATDPAAAGVSSPAGPPMAGGSSGTSTSC
jgi:hypothetical protein